MFYLKSFLFRWNWQNHNEADDINTFNQNTKEELFIFNLNLLGHNINKSHIFAKNGRTSCFIWFRQSQSSATFN